MLRAPLTKYVVQEPNIFYYLPTAPFAETYYVFDVVINE